MKEVITIIRYFFFFNFHWNENARMSWNNQLSCIFNRTKNTSFFDDNVDWNWKFLTRWKNDRFLFHIDDRFCYDIERQSIAVNHEDRQPPSVSTMAKTNSICHIMWLSHAIHVIYNLTSIAIAIFHAFYPPSNCSLQYDSSIARCVVLRQLPCSI